MTSRERFLMCPPDLYEVDYVINPWMEGNIHKSSREAAAKQWQGLFHVLEKHAEIEKTTGACADGSYYIRARGLVTQYNGHNYLLVKNFEMLKKK